MFADETKKWSASTLRGFEEMSRARSEDAARSWLHAADMLRDAAADDPLFAASRSNAGIGHLILKRQQSADRAFDEAGQSWQRVMTSIATLDIPIAGASSSFHFRLAAKVPQALIGARRHRYQRLAEAALAITSFNHQFVDLRNFASGVIAQRANELRTMLGDVLGPGSAEVRLLSITADAAPPLSLYGDKAADFVAHRQTASAALSEECARFEAAASLTALLAPQIFAAIRNEETKTATAFNTARA